MNDFEKDIISIINGFAGGKKISLTNADYEKIFNFSVAHQVECLFYDALISDENFKKSSIYKKFTLRVYSIINKSVNQYYELDNLYKLFNDNCIDFMPIKGAILSSYYPKKEQREMSDADILIKVETYDKIKEILSNNGYEEKYESNHEIVWKSEMLTLELHKLLIPSYNIDFDMYYKDPWKFAKIKEKSMYKMMPEDIFIYIFTHFSKHYRDGGAGIKYILDFKFFIMNNNLDFAYINKEFSKLHLSEFYKNINKLLNVWFDGKKADEKTEFITSKIFKSGVYGGSDRSLTGGVRASLNYKHVRTVSYIKLLFPPLNVMKERYAVLCKCPLLLPIMWVVRLFSKLFSYKDSSKAFNEIGKWNKVDIDRYKKELEYVGLKYYLKDEDNGNK